MSELLGRVAQIYVIAGAGTPNTLVGSAFDADFERQPRQVERNSYDTGAAVGRKVVRYDGDLTFKVFTNPADAGQSIIRAAVSTTTPAQITVDYAEEGNAVGKKFQRMLCNVRVKRGSPVENMAVTEVTLSPDGAVTESVY